MTTSSSHIELRGVRVHNLRNIDVDLPLGQITVITGVSGSGKSSLAFDTLYAEGHRRYIESFSAYARRFLDRLDKPDSDRIDNLPPAIALRQNEARRRRRDSIAAVTEIDGYLRLLFTRLGRIVCSGCGQLVTRSSAADVVAFLSTFQRTGRTLIGFPVAMTTTPEMLAAWQRLGLSRVLVVNGDRSTDSWSTISSCSAKDEGEHIENVFREVRTPTATFSTLAEISAADVVSGRVIVIVDRLALEKTSPERLTESAESALREGQGRCVVLVETPYSEPFTNVVSAMTTRSLLIDERTFSRHDFSTALSCMSCHREFIEPEPSLFNPRSPLGACPHCHGDGRMIDAPLERLVPDPKKSLEQDAFALLADPRWRHERRRLIEYSERSKISLKKSFAKLTENEQHHLVDGDSGTDFDGVRGFLKRLRRREQVASVSRYLAQWCNVTECSACCGSGLREEAQAVRLAACSRSPLAPPRSGARGERRQQTDCVANNDSALNPHLPQVTASVALTDLLTQPIDVVRDWLLQWSEQLPDEQKSVSRHIIPELLARLEQLVDCGLGYLSLSRSLNSLSHGEAQRVALSSVLASRLVNTLFVLDEPSAGLHPRDFAAVIRGIERLQQAGNTVVVIEHEPEFVAIADLHLTIGPGAGSNGGQVVSAVRNSTPLATLPQGASGENCSRRITESTRWLELRNVRYRNLSGVDVTLPLGSLCVITGVSGAGKSSLLEGVLWPALCRTLGLPCSATSVGQYDALLGAQSLDGVLLVDDEPIVGGKRSNPATWLKAFDEVRKLFADSNEAKNRALTPAYFSFNNEHGGRCPKCEGTGSVAIDMQFLADVVMHCPECNGRRFTREALEVTWRNLSIADVLALTASDAFVFFKGQRRLQRRLKSLKDVGLGYLTLGQPLNTLSGGEAQRLKLAATLARSQRSTLVLMNEPTTGLHPLDIEHLLKCFNDLLEVGQSLIVIENDAQVLAAADHILELGPGAGPNGGRVVSATTNQKTDQIK